MNTPRAVRLRVDRWRDPRLLIGLLLVVIATVGGAKIIAANDDTVAYWAVGTSATSGEPVTRGQLTVTRVRLTGAAASQYVRSSDEFPADLSQLQWAHDVEPGMLVARSDLELVSSVPTNELPVLVANGSLPDDLVRGDRVDVWVAPGRAEVGGATDEAVRVLSGVRVLASGADPSMVGASITRTVLIDAGPTDVTGDVVTAVATGHVTLIRVN